MRCPGSWTHRVLAVVCLLRRQRQPRNCDVCPPQTGYKDGVGGSRRERGGATEREQRIAKPHQGAFISEGPN